MGNIAIHDLEPVRDDERQELDLSIPVDYKTFCKHINNEYSSKCLSELPNAVTDSISLHERANFSFNCLTTLPDELPLRLPHISYLNLNYNKINSLPRSIGLLFHLKELLIAHNCLQSVPDTMTRLVKLQKIDLSFNKIEDLPPKLGDMESLRKLNVSNNKLKRLPKSLGCSDTIEVILAASNVCESQPPQSVCDSGSEKTIRFMKQLASGKFLSKVEKQSNVFPRIRGNVTQTSIPNASSARAQYVQIQTETMNTASRIRTPLLPPYDATQLHPDVLKDRIIGLLYGSVIGDALGIATEFLSVDECKFHYNEQDLQYSDIITDEHRVHWFKGDWTSNSDQMLLVLDSLLQWAGVVDELEFAKRLLSWKKTGIPELGPRENYMFSTTINLVLQDDFYCQKPHQVAQNIYNSSISGHSNGTTDNAKILPFVDSGCLSRSIVLGVPRFHDLNEVISNSLRICLATHPDDRCIASCIAISVAIALMLQGKYSLESAESIDDLLKKAAEYGSNYIKDNEVQKEFFKHSELKTISCIGLSEIGKVCHPFKAFSTAFTSFRQVTDFKSTLSHLLMFGGHSSVTGCLSGAFLGCKCGFSKLPKKWVEGLNAKNRDWLNTKINALLDMMGLP